MLLPADMLEKREKYSPGPKNRTGIRIAATPVPGRKKGRPVVFKEKREGLARPRLNPQAAQAKEIASC